MMEFDTFANQLLEEAKRFLQKAENSTNEAGEAANLHAALMLSFCALEAHVNLIGEESSIRTDLSAHEKGVLLEQDVRLEEGEFRLQTSLRMVKLEERIELMHRKLSGKPVDKSALWWGELVSAIRLRNSLTHAKTVPAITHASVERAMEAILGALAALVKAIYGKKFPVAEMGLNTRLTF